MSKKITLTKDQIMTMIELAFIAGRENTLKDDLDEHIKDVYLAGVNMAIDSLAKPNRIDIIECSSQQDYSR